MTRRDCLVLLCNTHAPRTHLLNMYLMKTRLIPVRAHVAFCQKLPIPRATDPKRSVLLHYVSRLLVRMYVWALSADAAAAAAAAAATDIPTML